MSDLEHIIEAAAERGAERAWKRLLANGTVSGTGPLLYSTEGAATVLGCSGARVRELIESGALVAINGPGRGRQVTRASLELFVERLTADEKRSLRVAS